MKIWKFSLLVTALMLVMIWAPFTFGAVSPEEAAKLGTTLTPFGAEMAGNKDGTIPPYTGGLTKPPASYKMGSGVYTDPFAGEKPLFSINAQNMAQYADKLTEGTKALMKKFPTYRIDVYKTHRTVAYPEYVLKNTAKNAVKTKTYNGGLSVKDAHAGIPFPIPKDGFETMWNHQVRFLGRSTEKNSSFWYMDSSGRLIFTSRIIQFEEYPYYDEDQTKSDAHVYYKNRSFWTAPARKAGEAAIVIDPLNMYEKGRIAYQYLPGQRRVKLAPEIGFDTPDSQGGGNSTWDENYIFNGSMERYDWKLVGKKEIYIPYNDYRACYTVKKEELFGTKHLNPDVVRWELHRMWIVEATLKPGKRHIYPKRTFYLDEDSWAALASDAYDAHGNIFKVNLCPQVPRYDEPAPCSSTAVSYNMVTNCYLLICWTGEGGYLRKTKPAPASSWTPASIAGQGVR